MTNEERQQIADLCRAHDEFMIEAREWLRKPPASESDDAGLIYKDYDNGALEHAPHPAPEQDWSGWERWLRGHLDNERVVIAQAIGEVIAEERESARQERDAELLKLRSEIAELRGKTDALLSMLQMKGGDIVDLRKRHA